MSDNDFPGSLEKWFLSLKETLETAYIKHEEPWKNSPAGFWHNRVLSLYSQLVASCELLKT